MSGIIKKKDLIAFLIYDPLSRKPVYIEEEDIILNLMTSLLEYCSKLYK